MKRLLLLLALAAAPVWGQNEEVQKVVSLKYVDPMAVANLLRAFGVNMQPDSRLKVLALSGRRNAVETAEAAIKQLDVPAAAQKDIELTVYFVVGSDQPAAPTDSSIPQDIQSTIATLKSTFPYKNYSLLDALSLQSRAGTGGGTSGQTTGGRLTLFEVRSVSMEGDGATVRLEHLHAGLRLAIGRQGDKTEYRDTGVTTDVVDVKLGQKLVVGRSSLEGPAKALFLVLIARVAE